MEILALELTRLLDIIGDGLSGAAAAGVNTVDVRSLAHRVEQLTRIRHPASVRLLPGPEVTAEADPSLVWRVLTNVVENAARATGPQGKVEIRLRDEREPAIDVIDDGPGLGLGPPGTSSLGLLVVTSLLESCGGALEVWSPLAGGTQVSIRLPAHGDGCAKPEGDAS
jgi:signal transduction histidine kinase